MLTRAGRGHVFILILLCLCGVVLSLLTLVEHSFNTLGIDNTSSYCHISATINCAPVLSSKWSMFLGLPLGVYGLAYYLVLIFASFYSRRSPSGAGFVPTASLYFVCSLGFLCSLILFALSHWVIGAVCPLCLGTYVVNFLLVITLAIIVYPQGLWASFLSGGRSVLFNFLKNIFGFQTSAATDLVKLSRYGLVGIVIICGLAGLTPQMLELYIRSNYKFSNQHQPTADPLSIQAKRRAQLELWRNQPQEDLKSDFGSGLAHDYNQGPSDAAVQIVEFSDFECPACRYFYPVLETILHEYQGRIHFVFRNYPLDRACNPIIPREMHRHACFAAQLARCAGEQGQFWPVAEFLLVDAFEQVEGATFEEVRGAINAGLTKLKLDQSALKDCMAATRQQQKISKDIEIGTELAIQGTPSLWVNGKRAPADGEVLRLIIEEILAGKR